MNQPTKPTEEASQPVARGGGHVLGPHWLIARAGTSETTDSTGQARGNSAWTPPSGGERNKIKVWRSR